METHAILTSLLVFTGVGVLAALLVHRLRLPSIAGFIIAGTLVGPHALGLIRSEAATSAMAEIGVILLLFTIGLEFSLERLRRLGKVALRGGTAQVFGSIAVAWGVARLFGLSSAQGLFVGFLLALSSTAIMLRGLSEAGTLDAPHGRFAFGVGLFQDLAVVPMTLLLPVLAGKGGDNPARSLAMALGIAAALVVVTLFLGRIVVPRFFARIDALRSREVFTLAVVFVCLGTSFATSSAGLSLALGAFLAGMMLAESEYAQRALGQMMPLLDVLASLFFVSLGMFLDIGVLLSRPGAVLLIFIAILFGKALVAALAGRLVGLNLRQAVLGGLALAPFSEFGFVLARGGFDLGLLSAEESSVLLAGSILTMLAAPLLLRVAGPWLERLSEALTHRKEAEETPTHHVLIAGLGVAGGILSRALARCRVPYYVLDLNADNVRHAALKGEPVSYGDVTSEETLKHAGILHARALVLLINDPQAARSAVAIARRLVPGLPILVRTRYFGSQDELFRLGATDVVSEELEAGVELLARVMRLCDQSMNAIRDEVRFVRNDTQATARVHTLPRRKLSAMPELEELKVESILLPDGAPAVARSATDLRLRSTTGALVVAVRRASVLHQELGEQFRFAAGDVVYVVGEKDSVRRAEAELLGVPRDG